MTASLEARVAELERRLDRLTAKTAAAPNPKAGDRIRFFFGRDRKDTGTKAVRVEGEVLSVYDTARNGRYVTVRFQRPDQPDILVRNVPIKQVVSVL